MSDLQNAIDNSDITCKITDTGPTIKWARQEVNSYRVTIDLYGRRGTFAYYQGLGCKNPPTCADVLYCLLSDSNAYGQSFQDFCSDMGLSDDSISALYTWKQVQSNSKRLYRVLGRVLVLSLQTLEH